MTVIVAVVEVACILVVVVVVADVVVEAFEVGNAKAVLVVFANKVVVLNEVIEETFNK